MHKKKAVAAEGAPREEHTHIHTPHSVIQRRDRRSQKQSEREEEDNLTSGTHIKIQQAKEGRL
jgi:hypothetical protein